MRKIFFICLVCLLFQTMAISSETTINEQSGNDNPPILSANEMKVIQSSNKLGIEIFRKIVEKSLATENVLFSPLSASCLLALCCNGAGGETRAAICSTMNMDDISVEEMNVALDAVLQDLSRPNPSIDFRMANSLWTRIGKAIRPDFIELARKFYDASVKEMNFLAPRAEDTINGWVERATDGRISKIVKAPIDTNIAAILLNALYFKGCWKIPFDTSDTRPGTFHLTEDSVSQCQMMSLGREDFVLPTSNRYNPVHDTTVTFYGDDEVYVLGLPYDDGKFRMSIVIPNRGYGYPFYYDTTVSIDEIIARLDETKWTGWVNGRHGFDCNVGLPKFKFEQEIDLKDILGALGMGIAFKEYAADFSNLFTDSVGWIDEIKQKTFIEVNERGTEAAAVSKAMFADALPLQFICDRPFLMAIHEKETNAILFIARIANPVWED